MYYQLSINFATSEIENAKKILEYAKQLDIEHSGLQEPLPSPEDFPWEEEVEQKHSDTEVGETGTTQEEAAPEPAPTQEEKVITLEMLQQAGANFIKKKGAATFKVLLSQVGATKVSNIPEDKYAEAWEAMQNA